MNELVKIEEINALEIFTTEKGLDPLLDAITKEVESFIPDISTGKGRKEIASLANRVAKSKVLLDNLGKDLTSDWKNKAKIVDNERKRMREVLEALKVKARKPLTEFEQFEKERIKTIEARIQSMKNFQDDGLEDGLTSKEIRGILNCVKEIIVNESFEELANAAATVKDAVVLKLEKRLNQRMEYEKQQEEINILKEKEETRRKEDEERKRKEYEENLKKEAARKARIEAEEKSKKESEKKEQERLAAIKEKEDAEKLAKAITTQISRGNIAHVKVVY